MDKFRIDSHKLIYHVERVNDWLSGKKIYPLYLEIAPSGACNQRCTFCALDFMEYKPRFLDVALIKSQISEMAEAGVKSIMYAGEGEPLLHKGIAEIVIHTKKAGIDVALTTNGVLLNKDFADQALGNITWIKVSINAATKENYRKIHQAHANDFARIMANMSYAAKLKKQKGYQCALGMQLLLLPENSHEVVDLAKKARDIGMDYLVVKPYSHHPFSKTTKYRHIKYHKYLSLKEKLDALNSDKFSVVFRVMTMQKWDEGSRDYKHCYAFSFWAYIDAAGNVWGCSTYLGDKRFLYGNIYKDTFKGIWQGAKRKKMLQMVENKLETKNCRVNCRMDEINWYLWELTHPPAHVNFI